MTTTVADVLAHEQPRLLPLPAHRFETDMMRSVSSGKTPYVRFDRNSSSIPDTHVRRPLTLLASATTVRVIAGTEEVARHVRSYVTAQTIEQEAHVSGLVAATRQANPSSARDRLRLAVPAVATCLTVSRRAANRSVSTPPGCSRCSTTTGPRNSARRSRGPLSATPSAPAPSHILETRRRQRGQKPPIPIALPDRPQVRDLDITPHRLETYDELTPRSNPDDLKVGVIAGITSATM